MYYFRKLDNKTNFAVPDDIGNFSLMKDDIWADVIPEFQKIEENTLSFYQLTNLPIDLERIVAALTCMRGNICKMDYSIIKVEDIDLNYLNLGINLGDTPDSEVNSWHRDFSLLTVRSIGHICSQIVKAGVVRLGKPIVKTYLKNCDSNNFIDWNKSNLLKEKLNK